MGTPRSTPEFKEVAFKEVKKRGYSVAQVAAHTGGSAHSLYKCVKAVSPDKREQHSKDLQKKSRAVPGGLNRSRLHSRLGGISPEVLNAPRHEDKAYLEDK